MGRVNDLFKGIFSKNNDEVLTNDNEQLLEKETSKQKENQDFQYIDNYDAVGVNFGDGIGGIRPYSLSDIEKNPEIFLNELDDLNVKHISIVGFSEDDYSGEIPIASSRDDIVSLKKRISNKDLLQNIKSEIDMSLNSMEDSEEVYYPSRESLLSIRDQYYDYMEKHGMTVNDMKNGDVHENYTKDLEEPIDESKYIYVNDPEDLADYEYDHEKYEIKYVGDSKYLEEISNILSTKQEFENHAPELLTEIENAEYMIDGINSHYGRDKIYQFNFINRGNENPDINVTFTDDKIHVYSKNDIDKLNERILNSEVKNEWMGKEESDITSIKMGDMSFDYQNLKDEKIKDFNILNEVDTLKIEFKNGTNLEVYNNKEEKEQFNRHDYYYSDTFLVQNYKNMTAGADSINIDKLDITVKDYMNYTIDKNKGASYPNSIDNHVEKHLQNKIDKRRSKNKDIEI